MSGLTDIDDREEFSAKIRWMDAETEKFVAEQRKLIAEDLKLRSEADKFRRERLTAVIAALAALMLGSAAVGGLLVKYLDVGERF